MLNRFVAQIALDGSGIDPSFASLKPQLCRSMCGWIFMSKPAVQAARSTMAWKPRVENGVPRSLTNTKGDLDSCSRCTRIGWFAAECCYMSPHQLIERNR